MQSLTTLSIQNTGTMHVPFLSRPEHKRLGGSLLRTTINICRTLGEKGGGGGGGRADATQWVFTRHFKVLAIDDV